MVASGLETENFSGDPRSGSSERRVKKYESSRSGKQMGGFVMRGLELKSSMDLG